MSSRNLKSILLEIEYAKRLRTSTKNERRKLVPEAYNAVHRLKSAGVTPQERTLGTSRRIVEALVSLCNRDERILEVGCGRGYTALKLAPYVRSIVGIDACEADIEEAKKLLCENRITNVEILRILADSVSELTTHEYFDKIISIDTLEHLHPEDYLDHLRGSYEILRPGGYYIAIGPNRLTGPHDVTKLIDPDATEAIGFHLNEFSYGDMVRDMMDIGFRNLRSPLPIWHLLPTLCSELLVPSEWFVKAENYISRDHDPLGFLRFLTGRLIGVFVIAQKSMPEKPDWESEQSLEEEPSVRT